VQISFAYAARPEFKLVMLVAEKSPVALRRSAP
jgi:hypothetical protein